MFKRACEESKLAISTLIVPRGIRWNNRHQVNQRAYEAREAITMLALDYEEFGQYAFTESDWEMLNFWNSITKVDKDLSFKAVDLMKLAGDYGIDESDARGRSYWLHPVERIYLSGRAFRKQTQYRYEPRRHRVRASCSSMRDHAGRNASILP